MRKKNYSGRIKNAYEEKNFLLKLNSKANI